MKAVNRFKFPLLSAIAVILLALSFSPVSAQATPSATLQANGQTGTVAVAPGAGVTLSWNSTGTVSCALPPYISKGGASGQYGPTTVNQNTIFVLSCQTSTGGSVGSTVNVIMATPTPVPTVAPTPTRTPTPTPTVQPTPSPTVAPSATPTSPPGIIDSIIDGLIIRLASLATGQVSNLFFIGGNGGPQENNMVGQIKTTITGTNLLQSILEIRSQAKYTNAVGVTGPNYGLKLYPDGSFMLGGAAWFKDATLSSMPLQTDARKIVEPGSSRTGQLFDFYFDMFGDHKQGPPKLYTRSILMHEYNDPVDIALQRSNSAGDLFQLYRDMSCEANNPGCVPKKPIYGPPGTVPAGQTMGIIYWRAWADNNDWSGRQAQIYAKTDEVATKGSAAGSLFLATSGKNTLNANKVLTNRISIRSNGDVAIGDGELVPRAKLDVRGDIVATGTKNFLINHPTKPGKLLAHAAIEGPEGAVYYRGEAQLINGKATVQLPEYFEKLTRTQDRTVLLTPKFDGDEAISNVAASPVQDGHFTVRAVDKNNLSQKFYWEVKAIRADIAPLQVER